jgi:hypothetical protein
MTSVSGGHLYINILFDNIKTILMIVGLVVWFQTPLYDAAANGCLEVVKLLVSSGADIDAKNVLIFFIEMQRKNRMRQFNE